MKLAIDCPLAQEEVQKTLIYQLTFYYPDITNLYFEGQQIIIESNTQLPEEKIKSSITKIIKKFQRIQDNFPKKRLFQSGTDEIASYLQDQLTPSMQSSFIAACEELIRQISQIQKAPKSPVLEENVHKLRKGLNIYGSDSSALMEALDSFFKSYFQNEYGAEDLKPPSMISSSVVHRAGYFATGCQHISFVAPISNDPDVFEEFLPHWNSAVDENGNYQDDQLLRYTKNPKDVLNPAICLHCYPLFENKPFAIDEVITLTMSGSVFRDESGNLNNDERLNEFKMREGIFLGNVNSLKDIHPQLIAFFILIGLLFPLEFEVETANDIFFDENAMQQLLTQLVSDNKIELSVYSAKRNKHIAIASINKHHNHFTKSFNITDTSQKPLHSMCIAFGLNRFEYVLREQIEIMGCDALVKSMQARLDDMMQMNIGVGR